MITQSPWLIGLVIVLVLFAGALATADAAISTFSKARAEELQSEGVAGAARLVQVLADPGIVLSTTLFLRLVSEIAAIVLTAAMVFDWLDASDPADPAHVTNTLSAQWPSIVVTILIMVAVSFVAIGVGPRTVGRQHAERFALSSAGILHGLSRVLGPLPRLLILIGNALTPGKGFRKGPFASEVELRELVDLAQASDLIEQNETRMIHSVFELGDTIAREVMVPRTEVVFIEQSKTLRQAMSLFLRSGYSRLPVINEDLDDIVGFAFHKDLSRRVFDRHDAETSERVEQVMRPVLHVPDTKPVDDLLREMQAARKHIAVVVDEYGGTAGLITIEDILEEIVGEIADEHDRAAIEVEHLDDGTVRVSSRYPVDDIDELFDVSIDDDEVDSVGGLMAKHLGVVPIAGSHVEVEGLRFVAESAAGRRNRIGTVLISQVESTSGDD